jgi:LAO/AO transport system kinase
MSRPEVTDTPELVAAIGNGQRYAIAAALNLLDDRRKKSRQSAARLLANLQNDPQHSRGQLIGITGPPGAGKSTLSAALIRVWRQRDHRVAVLAVDPSSPISGGALLGDRLRIQTSADDDDVFVRSLSNRGQFGGLSAEVWPMSIVMLAAFDIVLIETVGVGQREVDIARLCDTTCYVAQPGSGDSVQFLKAGILEVPHVLVVNKEDMGAVAVRTRSELESALNRTHPDGNWQVPVLSTSAATDKGIDALADVLEKHYQQLVSGGRLSARRRGYQSYWLHKRLQEEFGNAGIERLGGEKALLVKLQAQDMNLYEEYETLRQLL